MTDSRPPDAENPFPEPVEIEITDSIDLHSFSPKDIKAVVTAYLDEARKKGFRFVRIIHGKGIGVQRDIVRNVLRNTEFVKSFKSGDEFSGGWGATIAELAADDQRSSMMSAHVSSSSGSEPE
jgi:dsDNA-specific endonuclease/ATPase MutS2